MNLRLLSLLYLVGLGLLLPLGLGEVIIEGFDYVNNIGLVLRSLIP